LAENRGGLTHDPWTAKVRGMSKLLRIVFPLVGLLFLQCGMSSAVAQDWSKAQIVKYRVDGVHSGRTAVVFGDYEGKADVIDRVTVEFTWDIKKRKLIGAVTVTDAKSELSNLKSDGTNCPPPQLKGTYDHFQSGSTTMAGDLIQLTGTRLYPPASVSNYPASCSMRSIPAGKEQSVLFVPVAGPELLGMPNMPNMPGSPVTIAADKKSFTVKGAENWAWTYTPTLLQ
jgi:hypothetical protein